MSSLEKYVEKVKKETEGFSSIEKLRYIYWDLGSKFAFDLDFSFGNSKTRKQIYDHSRSEDDLNRCLENNTAICKSIAYIFSYVMKELGVNIESVIDEEDFRKCPHIYNVLITEDGRKYRFDLQEDMRNIKAQLRTQYFGIPIEDEEQELISRAELDQIDKKQGHISEKSYYTDEYLELIKMHLPMFEDFGQKVQFVLENSEAYTNPEMGYADRKWRMEDLIGNENKDGLLFSKEEKYKINMIDCYRENDGKKNYELCIVVNVKGGKDIYLFSEKYFANPNSTHGLGKEANKKIEETTNNIMDLLRKETNLDEDTEIIYTSGSSESNNLAIKGIAQTYKENGKHIISTFLEHSSVSSPLTYLKEQGYEIDIVNIKNDGTIDL